MKCQIGRRVIDPCPRKVATGNVNECQACVDDLAERAALIADGCNVSQDEGTRRAIKQAIDLMPGQREMVDHAPKPEHH